MANILNVILRITGQSSLGGTFTGLNQGLQLAGAAVDALNETVGEFIRQGVAMNAFTESATLQLTTLTGSAGTAKETLAELFDVAARTPFTFESVTTANRQLQVFGGSALATRDNLTLLGDSAAATGASIEEVTFWTGRLYSQLEAGRPIGEASRWLQRMGVLSGEARQRLDDLAESGATGKQIWAAYSESLQRFSGAMAAQEKTWAGLTSTMKDRFALLEGVATSGLFARLETQVDHLNQTLADPQVSERARQAGNAFGVFFDVLARGAAASLSPVGAAVTVLDRLESTAEGVQRNMELLTRVMADLDLEFDVDKATADWHAFQAAVAGTVPVFQQARDSWQDERQAAVQSTESMTTANRVLGAAKAAGDSASRSADALAAAHARLRDESLRGAEAQRIFTQQLHDEQRELSVSEQAFASAQQARHSYNIAAIEAANSVKVSDAIETNAKQAAENEKDAFNAAADAIREKNQQTADAIREAQQASQEAVRRAYGETADEAEAAYARIANAAAPIVDTLSQQLDEAVNRQVREGTAGTAEAEKQLDDIRKQHLATLPDLAAIDRDYAAAQSEVHDADVAVAAAERNLKVALAASGGQQTEYTAQLSHAITAAQMADQAARDHAAALGQERSQAISDTNALRGLAAQRASMGGGGGGLLLQDTGSQASRTTIYGMPITRPQIVNNNVSITNHGPVGVDDLNKQIIDTVQNAQRRGAIQPVGR